MLLMVVATVSTPVFADEERDYDDDSHERDYDDDSHERDYDDDSHERDYDDDSRYIQFNILEKKLYASTLGDSSEVKIELKFVTENIDLELIIDEILENFPVTQKEAEDTLKIQLEDEDKLEEKFKAEIEIENGITEVEVELKFVLDSTNKDKIIDSIIKQSILDRVLLEDVIKISKESNTYEELIDDSKNHELQEESHGNYENFSDTDSLNQVQESEIIQNVDMSVTAVMDGTNVIAINGKTTSVQEVSLLIRAPNENLIHVDQLTPDANGMFGTDVIIEGQQWSQDGLYTITTKQGNSSFNVIKLDVEVNDGKTIETIITETNQNNFNESTIVQFEKKDSQSTDYELQYDDELHDENNEVELEYEKEYEDKFEEEFEDTKISVESNSENFIDTLKKLFASWFGF